MPAITTRSLRSSTKPSHPVTIIKLRQASPDELEEWHTKCIAPAVEDLLDLDDPLDYIFQDQQEVWVRTKESNWCYGKVVGQPRIGKTRQGKQGLYFPVNFGLKFNVRKHFAPQNGEIKPDTALVRALLRENDWLDD